MVYDLDAEGNIDRGDNPKNPGDRGYGHGDQITFEFVEGDDGTVSYDSDVNAGLFVNFDGDGGVYRPSTIDNADDPLAYDGVVKHSASLGDDVTVHVRGAPRVAEDPTDEWPVLKDFGDGEYLIALR